MEPVITEIRIYANENGNFCIPAQYRSDVTYGENVKALAVSLYSEGVMSNDRIVSFLNAAGNGNRIIYAISAPEIPWNTMP